MKDLFLLFVWLLMVSLSITCYYYIVRQGDFPTTLLHGNTTRGKSKNQRLAEDFRCDWFRQRRARVEWQGMMKSCKDDMTWDPVKWDKIHRSDVKTSEIVTWDIRPAGEFSKIIIQSKTSDNRTKMIGGDTWRVDVRGPSGVAATVFDHQNGTYEALFLLTEPGRYQLMIHLDYSLCDGFRDPPRDWFINGDAGGRYQNMSILGRNSDHFLLQSFKHQLNITVPDAKLISSLADNRSCFRTCNYIWDGFGRWTKDKWKPYLEEPNNWSLPEDYNKSGTLWIYGDSVAKALFYSLINRPLCKTLYSTCELSYNWVYPMIDGQYINIPNDDLDFQPNKVIGYIVDILRKPQMQREESTLLLNIGLHMAMSVNFTTYQKLIEDLINTLKETLVNSRGDRVPKYKAKIIWKSTTAIKQDKRFIFITTQRILLFNAYAMSAMCQAGFNVLDVYPMTDSNPEALKDNAHYHDEVFDTVETMLEKYKSVNWSTDLNTKTKEARIKQCIN